MDQITNQYNNVIQKTDSWLHKLCLEEFKSYDILAIVNGILYAVFGMINQVAPNWPAAKENILNALEHFEHEIPCKK